MARTPLRPHVATPIELRERLRAEAAGPPFLVLRDEDDRQLVVELAGDRTQLTIGRGLNNDIILEDTRVSRHHAQLRYRARRFWIADLGSTNGTYINDEQVAERSLRRAERYSSPTHALTSRLEGPVANSRFAVLLFAGTTWNSKE